MLSELEQQNLVWEKWVLCCHCGAGAPRPLWCCLGGISPGTERGVLVPITEQAGSKASSWLIGMQTLLRAGRCLASTGLNCNGVI